jgi:hypothetical protein
MKALGIKVLVGGFLLFNILTPTSKAQAQYSCSDYLSAISSLRTRAREYFRDGLLMLSRSVSDDADVIQRTYNSECTYSPPTYSLPPILPPVDSDLAGEWISDSKYFKMSRKSNGNIDYQSDHPKYKYAGWINVDPSSKSDNNKIEGTFEDAWSSGKKCKGTVTIEKIRPLRYISIWKMNSDSCDGVTIKTMLNLLVSD